ncbi:MAG: helix-hairpin-helix domain-containing protein, partial [Micromonosporaceae bacterium]
MGRANAEVAALLAEYADLLAITGGDAFKARAYEKAARAIAGHHGDVSSLDEGGIRQIPNVGRSIAAKAAEIVRTGTFTRLEEARADIPAGVRRLAAIPTLGPKKALVLYRELGITDVDALVDAINAGKLRGLRGFGPKTEENILAGVNVLRQGGERTLLSTALALAEEIVAILAAEPSCQRCTYAGSLRRGRETIGDIDILAASDESGAMMRVFRGLPQVLEVIASGDTKTSVRTYQGLQVDLRVVPPKSWGAALQYFTGSKAHNVRVREIAVRQGLKLSEYGLFDAESGELLVADTEQEVYERLGLTWAPPTLREDRGEVVDASAGTLPTLV